MTTLNTDDVFEIRMLEYYTYILVCLLTLASYFFFSFFFFGSENARRPVTVFFDLILADFACKLYGFRMSNTTTRTSPGITLMSGVKIYSVNAADEDYQAFAFTSKLKVSRFGLPVD